MNFQQFSYETIQLSYFLSAPHPRYLIISGFHGDESEVIGILTDVIATHQSSLPPFLYIPLACPSAVARGTRDNQDGIDINRSYFPNSSYEETQALMKLLAPYVFESVFSFHEDPQQSAFYLYDAGIRSNEKPITNLKHQLKMNNIKLFSGIDDPNDKTLGLAIHEGYIYTGECKNVTAVSQGFFHEYTFATGKSKRHITIEIPGLANIQKKKTIVEIVFQTLINA